MNHQVTTNWSRIAAITLLNSAVVICWQAYHFYQPRILGQFQLNEYLPILSFSQNVALALVPVAAGWFADLFQKRLGFSYLIFTIGIGFTAFVFLASAYVFLDEAPDYLKGYIPFFMILWLVGMNSFYAPASGMILKASSPDDLNLTVRVISLVTNILFACIPLLVLLLDAVGGSITFLIGAFLLLGSAMMFKKYIKDIPVLPDETQQEHPSNFFHACLGGWCLGTTVFLGIGLANAHPYLKDFPLNVPVFIFAAILGVLIQKYRPLWSQKIHFFAALMLTFLSVFAIHLVGHFALVIALLPVLSFGICFVQNLAFPWALARIPARFSNLGIGLFFGSFSLPFWLLPFIAELLT